MLLWNYDESEMLKSNNFGGEKPERKRTEMARMNYEESDRVDFVELAQQIGIGPAMKELGYPKSVSTAQEWIKGMGVEITINSLKQKAREMQHFYTDREQMTVLMEAYDRINEQLQCGDLSADDIKKLSDALNKITITYELIAGRATERPDRADSLDLELRDLIASQKARNALAEQRILGEV